MPLHFLSIFLSVSFKLKTPTKIHTCSDLTSSLLGLDSFLSCVDFGLRPGDLLLVGDLLLEALDGDLDLDLVLRFRPGVLAGDAERLLHCLT